MRLRTTLPGAAFSLVLLFVALPAVAEKVPDLGRTKFKDIAKYLNLTSDQQGKIKPDVERIQAIVKDADKQRGAAGSGRRVPLGGNGVFGRPGAAGSAGSTGGGEVMSPEKFEERRAQRKQWETEIANRVDEIKSFLTPPQLEKFKNVLLPNLNALPSREGWRD